MQGDFFRYVEIGIGNGGALRAVRQFLSQFKIKSELHGVDLPNYSGDALHVDGVKLHFTGAKKFLEDFNEPIDFCFIDACHGKACVRNDFIGVEKKIRVGGVVAFHDTDPGCQGIHFQPHCGTFIEARSAVESLGLLNDMRAGWVKIDETSGDKGKSGHGCFFVKRI